MQWSEMFHRNGSNISPLAAIYGVELMKGKQASRVVLHMLLFCFSRVFDFLRYFKNFMFLGVKIAVVLSGVNRGENRGKNRGDTILRYRSRFYMFSGEDAPRQQQQEIIKI